MTDAAVLARWREIRTAEGWSDALVAIERDRGVAAVHEIEGRLHLVEVSGDGWSTTDFDGDASISDESSGLTWVSGVRDPETLAVEVRADDLTSQAVLADRVWIAQLEVGAPMVIEISRRSQTGSSRTRLG